jgi:hypothetical protein
MNSPSLGLRVASVIFGLVGVAHLVRIVARFQITIGSVHVHRWMSAVAVIVTGFLCLWFWMLSSRDRTASAKPEAGPGKP